VREENEQALRAKWGIPNDAKNVLIFSEYSHWDPNWLLTSEEYYAAVIRRILDRAIDELLAESRRVYTVESTFFLRVYWDRSETKRGVVRKLVDEKRLRLSGSAVTTPDTLVVDGEAVLRDFLCGQEWLRSHGLNDEPRIAYLPDNFGNSSELPSLLRALGIDQAAMARIDGGFFTGTDYRDKSEFPLAGSSAEALEKIERSLDFVWTGSDRSEILCHYHPYTYGHRDMLAHRGLTRWMGLPLAIADRSVGELERRVAGFVAEPVPLSRTPYVLCPIGFDFVPPIPRLLELLDLYNRSVYPHSGVYVVNASMSDYLDLVDCHRDTLPNFRLDPNPHWMGFYAARPSIKKGCRSALETLLLAERLSVAAGESRPADGGAGPDDRDESQREVSEAWYRFCVTNHHDFVTGTSPDRVWKKEQAPWVQDVNERARRAVVEQQSRPRAAHGITAVTLEAKLDPVVSAADVAAANAVPEWTLDGGRLRVRTPNYLVEIDVSAGGAIVSATDPERRLSGDRRGGRRDRASEPAPLLTHLLASPKLRACSPGIGPRRRPLCRRPGNVPLRARRTPRVRCATERSQGSRLRHRPHARLPSTR